jgi:transcription factor IIIB subunit 2
MKKIRMVSTLNSEIKKIAQDKVFYDAEEQELADIDDEEIESMILTPEEVKLKTQMWHAENKEYLKGRFVNVKQKITKKIILQQTKKKRRISQAATPAEAAKQLLSTRKFSAEINPNVFDDLLESPEKNRQDKNG